MLKKELKQNRYVGKCVMIPVTQAYAIIKIEGKIVTKLKNQETICYLSRQFPKGAVNNVIFINQSTGKIVGEAKVFDTGYDDTDKIIQLRGSISGFSDKELGQKFANREVINYTYFSPCKFYDNPKKLQDIGIKKFDGPFQEIDSLTHNRIKSNFKKIEKDI